MDRQNFLESVEADIIELCPHAVSAAALKQRDSLYLWDQWNDAIYTYALNHFPTTSTEQFERLVIANSRVAPLIEPRQLTAVVRALRAQWDQFCTDSIEAGNLPCIPQIPAKQWARCGVTLPTAERTPRGRGRSGKRESDTW